MRRIALIAATAAALLLPPAASAQEACGNVLTQGPCQGAEQIVSAAEQECRIVGVCPGYSTAQHRASWLHRALAYQYELGSSLPLTEAPWLGTHNSFNSVKTLPALSQTDANQQVSLTDQLDLDMRAIELDIHSTPRGPVVCHGEQQGIGCTTERPFYQVREEITAWLDAHRDQVVMIYIEDHMTAADERTVVKTILPYWRVYTSQGRAFASVTRDAVRAAGAQVVLVGGSGESGWWKNAVFAWGPDEWEDRPQGFADCRNAGAGLPPYASKLVRFYEDSTWLTAQAEIAGQSTKDDGLTPETVRAMVACGVELFGFDQLVPGDARLPATVWSWADGEEPSACALLREDGRWLSSDCSAPERPAACRSADGSWKVTSVAVPASGARDACAAVGAAFVPPRTGAQNAALAAVTDQRVWIGV